jgi:D-alanyl-D-alanine carboxypeptidase
MRQGRNAVFMGLVALVAAAAVNAFGPGSAAGLSPRTRAQAPASTSGAALQGRLYAVTAAGAPGAAAQLEVGNERFTVAAGVAELGRRSPLSPQSRFRVGSITKTFVATVVLQLVEEGRLGLDAAVAESLPELLPYGEVITVRQLLGHTSGLPEYLDDAIWQGIMKNRVFHPTELVRAATARPLLFPPGSSWSYSNTNYIVAGLLVERVTGNQLGEELQRRIFGPLGLGHTSFPTTTARIDGAHAHGYIPTQPPTDVTWVNPSHAWAAGAIVSTVGDVSRFYRSLLSDQLLGAEMLSAMRTTVPDPKEPGESYGLGLMRWETPCGTIWGHNGEIPGYHAWSFHAEDGSRSLTEMASMSLFPESHVPPGLPDAVGSVHETICGPTASAGSVDSATTGQHGPG